MYAVGKRGKKERINMEKKKEKRDTKQKTKKNTVLAKLI
jgi:hypothetical protein